MPTQERNPMAVREVCSSRSQKPNVLPTRRKGRPEENPSSNIASVLGRRKSVIRCLFGLTRPLCTGVPRNTTRTKCIHRNGRKGRGGGAHDFAPIGTEPGYFQRRTDCQQVQTLEATPHLTFPSESDHCMTWNMDT